MRKKNHYLVISLIAFLVLKLIHIGPRISDENLYFYMANLLSRGVMPYRDFFLANFPGQIFLYSLPITLFGFHLTIFKLLQILITLGSAGLIYQIMMIHKQKEGSILAVLLFLFSSVVLGGSDFSVGVHESTMFLLLAWYLLLVKRPANAGISLFLGLMIRRYIFPAAIGLFIYEYWKKNRLNALRFALIGFGLYAGVHILLATTIGSVFIDQVWTYHLHKPQIDVSSNALSQFIRGDKFLVLFSLVGVGMLLRKVLQDGLLFSKRYLKEPAYIHLGVAAVLAVAVQLIVYRVFSSSFLIYYVVLVPFLSILTALFFTTIVPMRSRSMILYLVVGLSVLNGLVYHRISSQKYTIESLDEIVSDVRTLTGDGETISGQYLITPLVSLLADRDITDHQADLNSQRFFAKLIMVEEATRLATQSAVFIQSTVYDVNTGHVTAVDPPFVDSNVLIASCTPERRYVVEQDFGFNSIILWKCGTSD